jgi:hypothetical protein
MATVATNLSGLFKETYADVVIQLVPEVAKLVKMVDFVPSDKEIGNLYHQPVIVNNEHGVTYAAQNGGAFTLNAAIAMNMQDAQVPGAQIILRSAIDYESAARASNDRKAFVKATSLLVKNMMESMRKRVEVASWYGADPDGLGQTSSSANASATSTVLQLTTASWSTGIWAGSENSTYQFYKDSDDSLVSSSTDSIFTISAVDVENRKLTVTGTATGITALDIAAAAGALNIFYNGAKAKEMSGLSKILQNTGTLFNVSATTYNLWKANSYNVSSTAFTFGKAISGLANAVGKGLEEKVTLWLNPRTWGNINTDLAALRRMDSSWKAEKGENGNKSITYYSQNGEIELVSHSVIKEGEAFAIPMQRVKRLGAVDITFKTPGMGEDEFFLHLADSAGFELRCYTDQHIFLETPAKAVRYYGIVNT